MSNKDRITSTIIPTLIMVIIMLFTVFAVLPMMDSGKVFATGETAQVTANLLNVRSGAGTSYSKIGSLSKGKTFTVKGSSKDKSGTVWYKLNYNSKTGYVSSKYVNIKKPTVTSVSNLNGTVNVTSGVLNVRSGPGSSYSKIGSLAKGKKFSITGKIQDSSGTWWYRLSLSGKTGYVSSKYIKTTSTASSTTTLTNTKGTVNISSGTLTVRSGPGTSYSSIGSLAKGKTFNVTGKAKDKSGKWWYILSYNGKKGYVYSSYVKLSNNTSSSNDTKVPENDKKYEAVTFQMGTITADGGLNVRSGAGTSYSKLGLLTEGSTVTVIGSSKDKNGKVWYKYNFSSTKVGYICSDYVKVKTVTSDSDFEAYMTSQGFPESYKAGLRTLHAAHPQWVFKAKKVGYNWSSAVDREAVIGVNLVSSSSPVSYRNSATYNSKTKSWKRYDGSWYAANKTVVKYYMDPRNFLNESGIYQFMTHTYDSGSQNANTVAAIIKGSFMQSKNPGGGYSSYASLINAAGKKSGVSPNVLAAMIIQEQGWSGSSLVSGTYKGYAGYYNFFNIGAYTTSSMNAVQRGLWYAKGSGTGAKSYSRPWNTPYKSILGGAQFYEEEYLSNNQTSYYSKKFNVYNGLSNVAGHQYMTSVSAAANEGGIVKRAYAGNDNYPIVFEIPVFNNMPSTACQLP